MTPTQRARANHYHRKGISRRDTAAILGVSAQELRDYYDPPKTALQREAMRLMKHVPSWWTEGATAWVRCVEMNFADVLGVQHG